jgi:ATP-dependent exoDNAse (exonuclease V) alpha subunit
VLIGPAGTGKTTLLSVLCNHPQIKNGGVTLLAPTGKARVQLEKSTNITTKTIAQFLIKEDRYDPLTGRYRLSTQAPVQAGRTVVIDEASMLTEEQLAATLKAVTGVERLILVGDPRQLPPIGSGRPFVDIVARLEPDYAEGRFPRVSRGYAELTIRRRQTGRSRDDLLLAERFSGQTPGAGADEVWDRVE